MDRPEAEHGLYGVPADLDLSIFVGTTLIQIGVGEFQLQFNFMAPADSGRPDPQIRVEGRWELRDSAGAIVDAAMPNAQRDAYRVHEILGHVVHKVALDAPHSFSLGFDDGHALTVYDDSPQYESFSIQPGAIIV